MKGTKHHGIAVRLAAWAILKAHGGIHVSAEEEVEGLDVGEHGNEAYPDFQPMSQS
jgi:Amt family ammonium transporter